VEIIMAVSDLTRAKYSALDFNTYIDDLQGRLQVQFAADFNDFVLSSMGILLMDMVANGLSTLSFYLDRRASDTYLDTARTRKAVSRLARQLGYKMRPAVSASVDLQVTPLSQFPFDVPIPVGFVFLGPNDTFFQAAEEVVIPAQSLETVTVPASEGQSINEVFISRGIPNQVFELRAVPDGKSVSSGSVTVTVDGAPFFETEFLEFSETNQFEANLNAVPPAIRFGDGFAGNIPAIDATIEVTYTICSGKLGLVGAGTITSSATPLVVNFETIPLTINNAEGSTGGDDAETLEHAKLFAPKVFKSRKVAVTKSDYEALSGSFADPVFGRVAVAQAIASRSALTDIELQNHLSDITGAVDYRDTVDVEIASAIDHLDVADIELDSIATGLGVLASTNNLIDDGLEQIELAVRSDKKTLTTVSVAATEATTLANSGQLEIAPLVSIPVVAAIDPEGLHQSTIDTLIALNTKFVRISSESGTIAGSAVSLQGSADSQLTLLGQQRDRIETLGTSLTATGSTLLATETARVNISEELGAVDPPATGLRGTIDTLDTLVLDVNTTVTTATNGIATHVESLLSADCKANLITVPILTRNSAGFYAAPSTGLVRALQNFLENRKEVSQTVVVTSGALFLTAAVITLRIGIRIGFSEAVLKKTVDSLMDGLLRDRVFGASLFVSDIVSAIKTVPGVSFLNATINGHLEEPSNTSSTILNSRLDASGNLIIPEGEVITKGTVTINTEVV
jgi:hypothetical protein